MRIALYQALLIPSSLLLAAPALLGLGGCSAPASEDTGLDTDAVTATGMGSLPATDSPAPTTATGDPPLFDPGAAAPTTTGPDGVPVIGNAVCGGSNAVGTIRDFTDQHPDFENLEEKGRGYGFDPGIVAPTLGPDRKPVYVGGAGITTSGAENFSDWFQTVDGINVVNFLAVPFTTGANGLSVVDSGTAGFFPIDNLLLGHGPFAPGTTVYPHNFHYTFELHTTFAYNPGDVFTFTGDDDVWVYINNQQVCDLGGVHPRLVCTVTLDTLGLVAGTEYPFDFFYAERHVDQSNFRIETSLVFKECALLR